MLKRYNYQNNCQYLLMFTFGLHGLIIFPRLIAVLNECLHISHCWAVWTVITFLVS